MNDLSQQSLLAGNSPDKKLHYPAECWLDKQSFPMYTKVDSRRHSISNGASSQRHLTQMSWIISRRGVWEDRVEVISGSLNIYHHHVLFGYNHVGANATVR